MSRADRFFRRLLRLFPAEFRGDFGDEMTRTFAAHHDDVVRGGAMAQLQLWKDTVLGVLTTAPREHWDLLRQDIRYGLRSLARSPGFAAVAVAVLAVGIGANTAIFAVVNGVLLESVPYRNPDRLVTIFEKLPGGIMERAGFAPPDFTIVREAARAFDGMAAYRNVAYELSGIGQSERVVAARVSPEIFQVLGVAPAIGRAFTAGEDAADAKVVVLSDGLWTRAFGRDPGILGRTIALDREAYVVVGVMPARFVFPLRGSVLNGEPAAVYVPLAFTAEDRQSFGRQYNHSTVARLRPDTTVEQARADLAAAGRALAEQYPASLRWLGDGMTFPIGPFDEEAVGRSRRLLLVLTAAVGMVLLIGCSDIASLMLTRSSGRQRELAIRSALGASQVRVVRQLLTESAVLAALGAGAGLLVAYGSMQALLAMAGESLARAEEIRFNGRVVLFTVVLALMTPLVFGVMPALRSAIGLDAATLRDGTRTSTAGRRRHRVLGALVIAQCALALILAVGAGLLLKSFARLTAIDTGFRGEHVVNVTMTLPTGRYATGAQVTAFYRQAVEAATALPGVTAVGAATDRPLNVRERRGYTPDSTAEPATDARPAVAVTWTVGRYFETLGIPLKSGRLFTERDGQQGSAPVVIVSEMLARTLWPAGDAVGRQIKWGISSSRAPWMTVVGVVGDIKQGALDSEIVPQVYEPLPQELPAQLSGRLVPFYTELNLIARSDRPPAATIGELRNAVQRLDPELAISRAQPVLEIVDDSVKAQRFTTTLLTVFAAVALSLATLGIYGVLASAIAQRTREIGVRLALGATTPRVLWMVLRRALVLAASGVALGLAGAFALTRAMSGLLYEVRPHDALTFAGASLGLTAACLLASLVPAWRATRVDPIVALRNE